MEQYPDRPPSGPLTPEARRRGDFPAGATVTLSDNLEWPIPLGSQARILDQLRDRMFDQQTMTGKVDIADVLEVAYTLFTAGYDIDGTELTMLLTGVDPSTLATAVLTAMCAGDSGHRTYGDWVDSALLANGLDRKNIPAKMLPHVLRQLVRTGRAEEPAAFISSMDAAAQRRRLFGSIGLDPQSIGNGNAGGN
jgi:hypothetical protein